MIWQNIKRRGSVPILSPEGISEMIKSCLKRGGRNI